MQKNKKVKSVDSAQIKKMLVENQNLKEINEQIRKTENIKTERDLTLDKAVKKMFSKSRYVQKSIWYRRLFEDGICEIVVGFYSMTIKFEDITYQLLDRDGKINVFTRYCEFLNYFDPQIHVQISIVNRAIDKVDFRNRMFLKYREDNLNDSREEYNKILNDKMLQGQNNIVREKYLTFTVKAADYKAATQVLYRVQNDILNNFKSLGVQAHVLSGRERLALMFYFFNGAESFNFDYSDLVKYDLSTKDFIAPASFDFKKKNLYGMGQRYGQTVFLKDLPPDLSDKLITELSDLPINMNINIHVDSVEQDKAFDLVKQKISFMEQQKIDEQRKAMNKGYDLEMIPWELKYSLDEAQSLLDDLQNKNQRIFKFTCLVHVSADSLEDLDDYVYQAVATAWDISRGAQKLEKQLEEKFGRTIKFGVGVNCGPAIVGNIGCDFRMDYTAIGDTVNTSARLESNAKAGQILISEDVYNKLKGRIEAESVGEIPLKGKSNKIEIFSVVKLNKEEGKNDESKMVDNT